MAFVELAYRKLTEEEVQQGLSELPGWTVESGLLQKEFAFDSYKSGLVFAVAVGHLADRLDHHPDLHIGYQRVRIQVSTHAVKGLSPYDLELARRIEAL